MIVSHASTTKMRTLPTHLTLTTLTTLKCHFRVGYIIFTISYAHNALYANYANYAHNAYYAKLHIFLAYIYVSNFFERILR